MGEANKGSLLLATNDDYGSDYCTDRARAATGLVNVYDMLMVVVLLRLRFTIVTGHLIWTGHFLDSDRRPVVADSAE